MPTDAGPKTILILRPSALGDVARTVPALVSCHRAWPEARIDWLVNDSFTDAIAQHPHLNEAVVFPRRKFKRFGLSPAVTWSVLRYLQQIRKRRYDLVIDLQGLSRSGWIARASGAPKRIGPADAREMGWLGYNRRIGISPKITHTVDRMLAVVEGAGAAACRDMRLYVAEADRSWAEEKLNTAGRDAGPTVVVAPGALWDSKRWPADRFGRLVERLGLEEKFGRCVLVGTDRDRIGCEALTEAIGSMYCLDLMGQTSVGQLMAVIDRADLILANDSAALHLARGLGRRCLGFFGPTDPQRVGPYRYDEGVVRCPDPGKTHYRHLKNDPTLMRQIDVETAWEQLTVVLQSDPPRTQFN
ncbi:MAG: glycosyltransferase family 9 protein [Phycisphaeraceae bacterium]|nr:glycosyltransferase family 9 protein [Phycisphaeraceae bacterium]